MADFDWFKHGNVTHSQDNSLNTHIFKKNTQTPTHIATRIHTENERGREGRERGWDHFAQYLRKYQWLPRRSKKCQATIQIYLCVFIRHFPLAIMSTM